MAMNGLVYGCLCLQSDRQDPGPPLDLPFAGLPHVEEGNHLNEHKPGVKQAFDFKLGSDGADTARVYAAARNMTISAYKVGDDQEQSKASRIAKFLLAMNSSAADNEQDASFLELAYSKVFQKTDGHMFVMLNVTSVQSKILLMARDVPVYMFAFCDDYSTYLMWSNEQSLEQRMRDHYGNRFYFYRMPPIVNGTCVIQSFYLRTKLIKWTDRLRDRLKIMNALEGHLMRRSKTNTTSANEPL